MAFLALRLVAPLPPLATRMELAHVATDERRSRPTTLIDVRTDPNTGRTYALARSGVLGNRGDLWLLEKDGGGWKSPLFVGVSADGTVRNGKAEPTARVFGKTAADLVEKGWLETLLVHRRELALDRDGDGLTDRAEARLGADPRRSDTDGDGVSDAIDPMPDAVPRPLDDDERVFAAVYQAGCEKERLLGGAAIILAPKGTRPFEIVGWPGPVLWGTDAKARRATLSAQWGRGLVAIALAGDDGSGSPFGHDPVVWNANRTEARAKISFSIGGMAGTTYAARVRKVEGDWKVVAFDLASIS